MTRIRREPRPSGVPRVVHVTAAGVDGVVRPFTPRVVKLTDAMVRAIRRDERPPAVVGVEFGVTGVHVVAIRRRVRKAHVSDEGPVAEPPRRVRGRRAAAATGVKETTGRAAETPWARWIVDEPPAEPVPAVRQPR